MQNTQRLIYSLNWNLKTKDKTVLTWVHPSWQGDIFLVWVVEHFKELLLKLLNHLESFNPLCGHWYGKGSSSIKAGFCCTPLCVCVWKVMTCLSATSPRLKGPAAVLGRPQVSVSDYHHWGFWERLHGSSFISVTNHALIAKLSLLGVTPVCRWWATFITILTVTKLQRKTPFDFFSFTGCC